MLLLSACSDINVSDMGSQLLPTGDQITVSSETFTVQSEDYIVPSIYAYPDSFLLGTFYDEKYGTTHADILAQVEKPAQYIYPENVSITPDSVYLLLYYKQYFGDRYSPMHISVYEMNKATFNYTQAYPSNLNPADYTDKSLLLGQKTITAVDASGEGDSTVVAIKLSNEFLQRFSKASPDIYEDEAKFLDFFKGLYITTDFGSATMLYLKQIDLEYFHHYTYSGKSTSGQDSTITVNNVFTFPANQSVRQVNRFLHPDIENVKASLQAKTKQVHYISSPANIFTKVRLPIRSMHSTMESADKRLSINSAKLRLDMGEIDTNNFSMPISSSLLLVRQNAVDRFFAKKELPSDTVAIVGTYSYELNPTTNEYDFYYEFDLARYIANEFKQANLLNTVLPEYADFVVVPVRVTTNSSNYVTKVKHQILMNAVTICGGQHPDKPMKIRTIFSKF
jgi:hypothetical protein